MRETSYQRFPDFGGGHFSVRQRTPYSDSGL